MKADRDSIKNGMRYIAVAALIVISAVPWTILVPILGEVNLLFLFSLWALFLVLSKILQKRLVILVSVIFAIAMAIPPVPNYVSVSGEHLRFSFIGFESIFGGTLWRLVFFFALHLVLFIAAAFLITHKSARVGAINAA
jgi:hypothetical protein